MQHDVIPAFADDHAVAHHDGAVGLIALTDRLIAQSTGTREVGFLGALGGLFERRQVRLRGGGRSAP